MDQNKPSHKFSVGIEVPSWVPKDALKVVVDKGLAMLRPISQDRSTILWFLEQERQDGFPIAIPSDKEMPIEQIQELCIRALMFRIEKAAKKVHNEMTAKIGEK